MKLLAARNIARRAVTLVEVIFSIGIILIGLLGLLSILPLASRRAQDSIALSVVPALASNVQANLFAEKLFAGGRLRAISASGVPQATWLNPSLVYTVTKSGSSGVPVGTILTDSQYQAWRSVLAANDAFDVKKTRVPSFCIDPMFASLSNTSNEAETPNGYFAGCFPFYKQLHDPRLDPSASHAQTTLRQPRMQRVGVTKKLSPYPFLENPVALFLTENRDDLSIARATDKSLPAALDSSSGLVKRFERMGPNSTIDDPRNKLTGRFPTGEFSWIATVNPYPDGVYASVSVVVLRRRVRSFVASQSTVIPSSPTGNAQSERVGFVTYKEGFNGGAGGTIIIQSNANTVSTLRSGDWIMLSRYIKSGCGVVDHHRWFRVLHVDSEAEQVGTSWKHRITLDGPDWHFGYDDGFMPSDEGASIPYNNEFKPYIIYSKETEVGNEKDFDKRTFATLIDGVVSVTERTVKLSDL